MNIIDIVATNLEAAMERSGLENQSKLMRASGVSQAHISSILRRHKAPTVSVLERLSKALRIEPWQLLLPPELAALGPSAGLRRLLAAYATSSPEARRVIEAVAAAQASQDESVAVPGAG